MAYFKSFIVLRFLRKEDSKRKNFLMVHAKIPPDQFCRPLTYQGLWVTVIVKKINKVIDKKREPRQKKRGGKGTIKKINVRGWQF